MIKRITAFLSAAVMSLSLCSCAYFEKQVTKKESLPAPPKLVFMGDSIAAGYGLEGYSKEDLYNCESYANILKKQYTQDLEKTVGHEMVNVAVSGETSQDLLDHLTGNDFDKALDGSDAVVISIGGNDLLHIFLNFLMENLNFDRETGNIDMEDAGLMDYIGIAAAVKDMDNEIDEALEKFDENITRIVAEINKKTEARVYVQTLYDPLEYFSDHKILADFAKSKIDRFNEIISENALEENGTDYSVIDLVPDFAGRSAELTNIAQYDIHPNAEGHKLISKIVDRALQKDKYFYYVKDTVKDQAKINRFIIIAASCVVVLILGIVLAVWLIKHKKSNNSERN